MSLPLVRHRYEKNGMNENEEDMCERAPDHLLWHAPAHSRPGGDACVSPFVVQIK
jgi:hypothetical protein